MTPLQGFRIHVEFIDGTQGEVDLSKFLSKPDLDGTIFETLRDEVRFREVEVVLGAVQWSCGADLAPDAMYDEIVAHGIWTLE